MSKKNILAINGSASGNSSNERLIENIVALTSNDFRVNVYNNLKSLPHFDPQLSSDNPPQSIIDIRKEIEEADGVIICTPEYIFSVPSGLKNLIEWCVSSIVFTDKPLGIITASLDGKKGHEELILIMKTLMTKFNDDTTLLIPGIKGKVGKDGSIPDEKTREDLAKFIEAYKNLIR